MVKSFFKPISKIGFLSFSLFLNLNVALAVCIGGVCNTFNLDFEDAYPNLYPTSFATQDSGLVDFEALGEDACKDLKDRIEFEVPYEDKARQRADDLCLVGGIQECAGPCGEKEVGSCFAEQKHEREYVPGLCTPVREMIDQQTGKIVRIPARCDCKVEIKCSCRCKYDPLRDLLLRYQEEVYGFGSKIKKPGT